MSLQQVIADVNDREKTLAVPGADLADRAAGFFRDQNVTVEEATADRRDVAVLRRGGAVLARVPVDDLREMVAGGALSTPGPGVDDSAYRSLLGHLKETTFTSYDVGRMRAASHEIEDRALRTDGGTLYVGFQYASMLDAQRDRYEALGASGVAVHVYAYPDRWTTLVPGVTVHLREDDERRRVWYVVYDGAGRSGLKSALVAEERGGLPGAREGVGARDAAPGTGDGVTRERGEGPGNKDGDAGRSFYGFWTYDPGVVDRLCRIVSPAGEPEAGSTAVP